MKKNLKKALVVLMSAILVMTLLAGCGSKTTDDSASSSESSSSESSSSESSSSESSGENNDEKVLTMRLANPVQATDWAQNVATVDMAITWIQVFEGLYGMDEGAGGYYPALAEDVQISDDQLTYTIKLRDAKFQNGDQLKASDVVFSYDRAMENSRFNYLTNMIDSYKAVDDSTFEMKLKYPYSAILHTFFSIKISSEREVTEQGDAFGTKPHTAGTGPYIITEYDPAGGLKLQAFPDYWGGEANIKNVEYFVISEDSAAVIAYEKGEIGYLHDAPTSEWEDVASTAGDNCTMVKGNNIRTLWINWESKNNDGILANENVRKAIFYALNKENINQVVTSGYGAVSHAEYIPSDYCATSPNWADGKFETYEFDTAKAHQCLLDAGFTEEQIAAGIPVGTITTYGGQTAEKAKAAQVIQSNLKDIGLLAEVEVQDISIISPRLHAFDYDMCIFGDSGNYDFNNIRQVVASESNGENNAGGGMSVVRFNGDGTNSPFDWQKIDDLVNQGVAVSDQTERYNIYTELWKTVMDTAIADPFLHLPVGIAWREDLDIGTPCPTYYRIYNFSWK